MLHLICCVREENYQAIDLYKDKENELFSDIAQTWKDAMLSLYAKGCRYLQFETRVGASFARRKNAPPTPHAASMSTPSAASMSPASTKFLKPNLKI